MKQGVTVGRIEQLVSMADDGTLYIPVMDLNGGGGGTPAPGSITTEMFAPDAKTPRAGIADSAESVVWDDVDGKPSTFAPSAHQHSASDINSGTLADARIPALAISKISGLQTSLDGKIDKSSVSSIEEIADPSEVTLEEVATKLNAVIVALQS